MYGISTISQSYTVSGGEGVKTETFTQEQVAAVLEPRVDEIADMIQECIDDSGIKLGSWSTDVYKRQPCAMRHLRFPDATCA